MIAFDPKLLHGLEWKQPSTFKRSYELRAGDTLLATLEWQKTFGSLAEARIAQSSWTFKRQGFLNPKVTIRTPASAENDIARYEPHWGGSKGELYLEDGAILHWKRKSLLGGEWEWQTPDGAVLLHFHVRGILKHGAEVSVDPAAAKRPDVALLILLGWYLLILHIEDSSAAIGAS